MSARSSCQCIFPNAPLYTLALLTRFVFGFYTFAHSTALAQMLRLRKYALTQHWANVMLCSVASPPVFLCFLFFKDVRKQRSINYARDRLGNILEGILRRAFALSKKQICRHVPRGAFFFR